MSITIHEGSILDSKADCIVNPANSFLNHGGGLARVIADAARGPLYDSIEWHYSGTGPVSVPNAVGADWLAEQSAAPLVATGDAFCTTAGNLPFKGIIHAVGPIYKDGSLCETDLLELAVESAIFAAQACGYESIAFPAISCGIFGFPVEEAARIHVEVAGHYAHEGFRVEFWPFGHEGLFKLALAARRAA